jgi:hypothetical protein
MIEDNLSWPDLVEQGVNAFRNMLKSQEMIKIILPDKIPILYKVLDSEAN